MSHVRLSSLEKRYPDGTLAVRGISLSINSGDFVVLLGPSGCGKTTTLRMIAGLEIPTAGSIHIADKDVTCQSPSARDVGFVFQFYALYPQMTVRENIAFPLECAGIARREARRRAAELAERLGLTDLLDRRPRQLSGGDQQRVSLARAMIRQPKVYLMDEPLGTLDAERRSGLREFIKAQQLATKVTTVYVTHDQEEAASLGDVVVVMDRGMIRQVGTPADVYERPADTFVAHFVGSPGMNMVDGLVTTAGGLSRFALEAGGEVALPRALPAGPAVLGFRPEYVHLDASGSIAGRVVLSEYLGAHRHINVDTSGGRLVARTAADVAVAAGDEVRLSVAPAGVRVFSRPVRASGSAGAEPGVSVL